MIGWWCALGAAWAAVGQGEEVSQSRGKKDGVVVLWPRLVPASDDQAMRLAATGLQAAVAERAGALVTAERVDTRPEPERVCPREGCRAVSVSLLIGHQGGGCAVVALVGPPGPEAQRLVPLVGTIDLAGPGVSYRSAPEGHVVVREFVPCEQIREGLDLEPLARAISEARGAAAE